MKAVMRNLNLFAFIFLFACFGAGVAARAGEQAILKAGEHTIGVGQSAEFPISSSKGQSVELHAWCDVSAAGRATVMLDAEHYVPLSEPAVGDTITLSPNETRRVELQGTIEANEGDAYVAFVFTGVPTAMCFPGMQCDGTAGGANDVRVKCGND